MRKLLFSILIIGLATNLATAQDESFRFFLDPKGAGEQNPRPSGSLNFINPTLAHSGTLYVYLQYGTPNQDFSGTNLRIDILGTGAISGGNFYNHAVSGLDRWQTIPNKNWVNDGVSGGPKFWITGSVFKVGGGGFGAKNVGAGSDSHFSSADDSTFGTTLLGSIDLDTTGVTLANPGRIYLSNGSSGSAGVTITPSDFVYFGFNDAAVPNKKGGAAGGVGGPTAIAEAFLTPEPVSLALLSVGALVFRCRR